LSLQAVTARVELTTTSSLKANRPAAMPMLARTKGARIWWAERPAAFIATTSLFWFNPMKFISVPTSTEKGRKRENRIGRRSPTYRHRSASVLPGTTRILPDSPSRSSVIRISTSATRTARLRVTNSRTM